MDDILDEFRATRPDLAGLNSRRHDGDTLVVESERGSRLVGSAVRVELFAIGARRRKTAGRRWPFPPLVPNPPASAR